MNKIIISTILLLFPLMTFAAMNSELKECLQRGYKQTHNQNLIKYCVFPDGNKCTLETFNNGACGTQYKNEDYCVAEGLPVWDASKCCAGTESYILPNYSGQPKCINISTFQKILNQLRYNYFIWIISIGIILFFVTVFIYLQIKKRIN